MLFFKSCDIIEDGTNNLGQPGARLQKWLDQPKHHYTYMR